MGVGVEHWKIQPGRSELAHASALGNRVLTAKYVRYSFAGHAAPRPQISISIMLTNNRDYEGPPRPGDPALCDFV